MSEPELRNCARCGRPLPVRAGPGRPRVYCVSCTKPISADVDPMAGRRAVDLRTDGGVIVGGRRARFGERGAALWSAMVDQLPGPLHRDLLTEACRLADRLDRMNDLLNGDRAAWAVLQLGDVAEHNGALEVTLIMSSVISEARTTASAFKMIVAELRQAMREAAAGKPQSPAGDAVDDLLGEIAAEDELAARRRAHGGAS
jgi:hypothetical protein